MKETTIDGQTPDITVDSIGKLKELFPEIVTENRIDFEKFKAVLGEYIDDESERYNFTWNGKSKALRLSQIPSTGTLRPCKEESKDWDTTKNLYIEGDNLEVLKLLQKAYHNKIKMIYIDPPYNTGNDFVYSDDYKDNLNKYLVLTGQKGDDGGRISTNSESSGRYHTNWLNMMYPRLRLARNLLTDDGVIFISIDDNEIKNLKAICDEIFGEENYLALLTIVTNLKGRNDSKYIARCHEYLLVYGKSDPQIYGLPLSEEQKAEFKYENIHGEKYALRDLRKRGGPDKRVDRPNMFFPLYFNHNDKSLSLARKNNEDIEILPIKGDGSDGRWRWGRDKVERNIDDLEARYSERSKRWDIDYRVYLNPKTNETDINEINVEDEDDEETLCERKSKPKSFWLGGELSTDVGKRAYKDLMGKIDFDFPKSVEFIVRLIHLGMKSNDIFLDFFSGSSTSAHAIFQLNAEDGGNRRFIMVQLPEPCKEDAEAIKEGYNNICEIGKERIRRAGEKIKSELKTKTKNQISLIAEKPVNLDKLDVGFKVLKLDSSNIKKWNPNYDDLDSSLEDMISNYTDERCQLDVIYEIMLKYGIDLALPIEEYSINEKKVYSIGFGALMICLDDDVTIDIVTDIIKLKKELNPETMRVVFKDNGFKNDAVKTNVKENLRQAEIDEFITL